MCDSSKTCIDKKKKKERKGKGNIFYFPEPKENRVVFTPLRGCVSNELLLDAVNQYSHYLRTVRVQRVITVVTKRGGYVCIGAL